MNPADAVSLRPQRISATSLSLGILALIAVGAVLKAAQGVVIPLLIAWLLSYLLAPAVTFLVRRLRFPAGGSVRRRGDLRCGGIHVEERAGKREQAGRQSDHLIPPLRGHCRDALSRASHARGSCQFRDTIVAD